MTYIIFKIEGHISQYISREVDKSNTSIMTGIINKIILFALCRSAFKNEANSSLITDSMDILQLLNATLTAIDKLSVCYDPAYLASGTIQEKQRCFAILANLQVSRSVTSRRRNRIRNRRRPLVSFRTPCTKFRRRAC